jgi:hypothetical protein
VLVGQDPLPVILHVRDPWKLGSLAPSVPLLSTTEWRKMMVLVAKALWVVTLGRIAKTVAAELTLASRLDWWTQLKSLTVAYGVVVVQQAQLQRAKKVEKAAVSHGSAAAVQ